MPRQLQETAAFESGLPYCTHRTCGSQQVGSGCVPGEYSYTQTTKTMRRCKMIDVLAKIKSERELEKRFGSELSCQQALADWKWPKGFDCKCGGRSTAFFESRRVWYCRTCGAQTSLTAGTVFAHTKTPLPVWFRAVWVFLHRGGDGRARSVSRGAAGPLTVQRFKDLLHLKRYQTAWTWMQKIRAWIAELGLAKRLGPNSRHACARAMKATGTRGRRAWGWEDTNSKWKWHRRPIAELRKALLDECRHPAHRSVVAWIDGLETVPVSRKHFGRWLAEGLLRCWQSVSLEIPFSSWGNPALPYWRLIFRPQPPTRLLASWEG